MRALGKARKLTQYGHTYIFGSATNFIIRDKNQQVPWLLLNLVWDVKLILEVLDP